MFLKHAKMHNKLKEGDTMVAILAESAKILVGNPYLTGQGTAQIVGSNLSQNNANLG